MDFENLRNIFCLGRKSTLKMLMLTVVMSMIRSELLAIYRAYFVKIDYILIIYRFFLKSTLRFLKSKSLIYILENLNI